MPIRLRPDSTSVERTRTIRRRALQTLVAVPIIAIVSVAVADPANAATGNVLSGGGNIAVRTTPDTSASVITTLAPGSSVSFGCYVQGSAVSGPYGTETVWDAVTSGGYVPDAWIYTGSNNAIVPPCSSGQYPIAWTGGIGVYPRASTSMNSTKIGSALPEGALVTVVCETTGDIVTDTVGYTSSLWDQISGGTYVANVYLNTGVNGPTPGIPACATPPPPPPTVTPCVFDMRWSKLALTFAYGGNHRYLGNAWQAAANWTALGTSITIANTTGTADINFVDYYVADDGHYAVTQVPTAWMGPSSPNDPYTFIPVGLHSPTSITIQVNQYYMDKLDDFHRTYALTHELGHALGLGHSNDCTAASSIMQAGDVDVPSRTINTPQYYDRIELEMLYGLPRP